MAEEPAASDKVTANHGYRVDSAPQRTYADALYNLTSSGSLYIVGLFGGLMLSEYLSHRQRMTTLSNGAKHHKANHPATPHTPGKGGATM